MTDDAPVLFRLDLQVGDLDRALATYGQLLDQTGRKSPGARCYFDAGSVTLQVVEVEQPHPVPKALYFTVDDLEPVFARAEALGWLSNEPVHGEPGGAITVRPWGERSFYAEDEWGNPLCFVQTGTVYPG